MQGGHLDHGDDGDDDVCDVCDGDNGGNDGSAWSSLKHSQLSAVQGDNIDGDDVIVINLVR